MKHVALDLERKSFFNSKWVFTESYSRTFLKDDCCSKLGLEYSSKGNE